MPPALAIVLFAAVGCGGASPATSGSAGSPPSPVFASALPRSAVPAPTLPPGACTRAGMTDEQLVQRWLELSGRHDQAGVRDCFAASYGIPDAIVQRWADLGHATSSTVSHSDGDISDGCDRFGVTATFPNGNPYAPVQDATTMFFVVGVGPDGDRPRIFGTATAAIRRSPDVTPHVGSPDCR